MTPAPGLNSCDMTRRDSWGTGGEVATSHREIAWRKNERWGSRRNRPYGYREPLIASWPSAQAGEGKGPSVAEEESHHEDMAGLVLGVHVLPSCAAPARKQPTMPLRKLRLVAQPLPGRPARQTVSVDKTYDFELQSPSAGELRLEVFRPARAAIVSHRSRFPSMFA